MKKLKQLFSNYLFNIVLVIALSALIFYLTVRDNPAEVFDRLKKADRLWLLVVVAAVISIRLFSGFALKQECNLTHPEYTFRQGVENAFVGGLFNEITPSASGGQFAQVFLFRRQGIPLTEAAGVLWMNFIIYQTTMVVSVFILLLLKFHEFYSKYSQFFVIVLLGFAVNAAVIVSLWALIRFPKFYTWLSTKGIAIAAKLHIVRDREKALASLDSQITRFQNEINILSGHKDMVFQVALTHFLRLMVYYSIPFFCTKALRIPISWSSLLDMITLSSFVSMVNAFIPLPGASGGTEASFLLMFSTVLGPVNVRPVMLLWRFMTYYFDMMLGGAVFLSLKARSSISAGSLQEAEKESQ
ncbi:MAG: flippase-like domain-containing protein [Solobacterium sp.]|nr:flippase-like domain-containing protein [Solobacterium sp.]